MYILNSSLINAILTEYTEKVKFGYNKIPYDSWRTLKKLSNANTDYAVKIEITDENSILYLTDTKTDITSEIFVTDGFAYLVKERTIHMVDTNSNISAPMPNKSDSVSRKGFNMNFDFGHCGTRWLSLPMAWLFVILRVSILPTILLLSRLLT